MLFISTTIREQTDHSITVSADLTNHHNKPSTVEFFVVTLDRITGKATVFHDGKVIDTKHGLGWDVEQEDVEAFAICAILSLAFNIQG